MFEALKQKCSLVMSASTDFRIKQRSVIEFWTLEWWASIKIHRHMKAVYGNGCMDVKNVRKWVRHAESCCAGEMGVLDEHRQGWPISVNRDENQCRVDAMIQENCQIKQRDIALKLGISQERVYHITETLNYKKVCARWVPRQLTATLQCTNSGHHDKPEIHSGSTPSLQPRLGTVRLLVVPKIEGDIKRSTFFIGCQSWGSCAQMDQQPTRNFLHGRNEQMERTTEKMCSHKWWLCWKISVQCVREINFIHSGITVIILHCQKLILYSWRPHLSITPRKVILKYFKSEDYLIPGY